MSDELRFDSAMKERWLAGDGGYTFEIPPGWAQGRSTFGGLVGAALVALGERQTDRRLRLMSLQLVRPAEAGTLVGSAEVVREGKGTAFVRVTATQKGDEVAHADLVFVRPREPSVVVPAPSRSWEGDPEALVSLPYVEGILPEFLQHIDLRWATGSPPFSSAEEAHFCGFCRHRGPSGGAVALIGLLDAWPCPTLSVLDKPTFSSTVSWTAHVLHVPDVIDDQWFAFEYRTVVGHDGFHTAVGKLHGPDGALVAWSEQLFAVFDR